MVADKPVVLVTRKLPEAVEERLRRDFRPLLNPDDRRYGADELIERSAAAAAVLTCSTEAWPAAQIERLPAGVRAIATFSVGADHIDLAAARARGITVTNTPDVLTEATADIAMLCLLGAARRAFEGETLVRVGKWTGWTPTQLLGLDLSGAVLGIVGMGRIGQAVARRRAASGCRSTTTTAVAWRRSSSTAPSSTTVSARSCRSVASCRCTARAAPPPGI